GIRDFHVTGVQTCALPIFPKARYLAYGINMGGFKLGPAAAQGSLALRGIQIEAAFRDRVAQVIRCSDGLRPFPGSINDLALLARSEERRVGKGGCDGGERI